MLEWVYPYTVRMAHLPGQVSVAYIDEGQGPYTLLFLHGLGSYLKAWKKNVDDLRAHFRCIALDFPGYGKSSKNRHPYGVSFFAQTVQDFIQQLELENVVLAGHSMGGHVSIILGARNLPAVKKMVLIAPAGFETFTESDRAWLRSFYSPSLLKKMSLGQITHSFEINFYRFPDDARFMIADRLLMQTTDAYDAYCDMIPQCLNSMLDEPVFHLLPHIRVPVLVIYGENDALIPNKLLHPRLTTLKVAEAGMAQLANGRLEMLRHCGHFAQWECAGAVNRSIRQWLS